ncbi:ribokinase [Amycolatopsis nigrescens]|uniref:ribokinase n=1 Tax=Amycolatopsis nigrescens TaxID=381445 RepID=UPI00036E1F83|nr:ribokinase [Amycolatopsis nigrescens]
MTARRTVLVVGSTMVDMITYLDRPPAAGETVAGREFQLGFGGKGANQAVMARLLGAEVLMVNRIGDDVFGEMTMANFRAHGIGTEHVTTVANCSSGVAPIQVEPDGTNRIVVVPGANERMTAEQARAAVAGTPRLGLVLGQFEIPQAVTAAAFRAARDRGATTVLNPAPAAAVDPELLAVTDWMVPNETEFLEIAGVPGPIGDEAIAGLAARLGVRLAVTLGERGVALLGADGVVTRIEPPPAEARDTTGAGDAFVGAFGYGLASGMDEVAAARLGCACASASVRHPGTQKSFPTGQSLADARSWAG